MKKNTRDIWVDNVKVVACILVVLGHFYQSMVQANFVEDSIVYNLFIKVIYLFHVPLFFICSGFLYQKYSNIEGISSWRLHIFKKFLALGIPYFIFSFATWLLKKVFSSSVNNQIGGIVDTLFVNPASPYWFLYILFFIFVFTLTTRNLKYQWIMLAVSVFIRLLQDLGLLSGLSMPFIISKTIDNWLWFVFGMFLAYDAVKYVNAIWGIVGFLLFLCIRVLTQYANLKIAILPVILSFVACYSIISVFYYFFKDGYQSKLWKLATKYTMPVFLMHTLFAATFRSVLIKLGVGNVFIHILLGIVVSFCGPVIAMIIFEKLRPLDFIVYPMRYIKVGKRSK